MKAKTLKPKLDELKRGDRVAVYRTDGFPASISISTTVGATTLSRGWASAFTYPVGHGFVLRVYKHIGAVIVKLGAGTGERKVFIKENDPQWSFYIEEEK